MYDQHSIKGLINILFPWQPNNAYHSVNCIWNILNWNVLNIFTELYSKRFNIERPTGYPGVSYVCVSGGNGINGHKYILTMNTEMSVFMGFTLV